MNVDKIHSDNLSLSLLPLTIFTTLASLIACPQQLAVPRPIHPITPNTLLYMTLSISTPPRRLPSRFKIRSSVFVSVYITSVDRIAKKGENISNKFFVETIPDLTLLWQ
jgi:hypothetical protein